MIVASLGLPRAVLNMVAGATFGLWSLLIIEPSITVGATNAFLVSRHFFADRVHAWTETMPLAKAISESIDWKIVALTCLASPLPSFIASYLFGITRIGIAPFTLAKLVCTLPQNLLQIYLAAIGRAIFLEVMTSSLQLARMTVVHCMPCDKDDADLSARAVLRSVTANDWGSKPS